MRGIYTQYNTMHYIAINAHPYIHEECMQQYLDYPETCEHQYLPLG